jgi:spore coat protein U-like protein
MNLRTRKFLRAAALTAAATLAASSLQAQAGSASTTFNVTITLVSSCSISANTLNFGSSVGLLTSAVTGNSTLSVTCSNTTPYNVGLDGGNVSGSTVSSRLMAGTTAGNTGTTIGFQLYTTSGLSTVWGNSIGTNTVSGTGTGSAQTLTVYAQVPAQTTPKPDTYQTTITATVSY